MVILEKDKECCDTMINPEALTYLSIMMNRSNALTELIHYFADKKQLSVTGVEHFILKSKLLELEVKEVMGSFACRILSQNYTVFEKVQKRNAALSYRIKMQDYPYYDQKRDVLFLRGRMENKNNEPFIVNLINLVNILNLLKTVEDTEMALTFNLSGVFSNFRSQALLFNDEESLDKQINFLREKCLEALRNNQL